MLLLRTTAAAFALGVTGLAGTASADIQHLDDVIIGFSLCVGNDCNNGESFGFDTVRLKENNVRLHFDDTSSSASFPNNDWRLTANDSSNGGGNYFAIEDATGGKRPFSIEAGAPTDTLYVDSSKRIGVGTSTPVTTLHTKDGNTPTLRLEQDGSSGFTAQTWDMAGNEANFFVRDVTNGSTLPFRIFPGAPSNALTIEAGGDVGIGTTSPAEALHIASGENRVAIEMDSAANDNDFRIVWNGTKVKMSMENETVTAMDLTPTGDLTIAGGLVTGTAGSCESGTPCDAVFDPAVYTVPSIKDHASAMWKNKHLPAVGPTLPNQPLNVSSKMLRMLNELEHAHIYIEQLNQRIEALEATAAQKG